MAFMIPRRPGAGFSWAHFSAINRWCQRMRVSGVTMVATRFSRRRPSCLPFAARRRRWNAVLLDQVLDRALLLAIHPA
jgi:hypothetical protein